MILGLHHVGIAVRSIASVRGLYEALGLEIQAVEELPGEGVRVAIIPCGGTRIELLEPLGPDTPVGRFLERRGPGVHHICLATDDIGADDARLRSLGYQLVRSQPTPGAGGSTIQFLHPKSTGGVLIELAQEGSTEGS